MYIYIMYINIKQSENPSQEIDNLFVTVLIMSKNVKMIRQFWTVNGKAQNMVLLVSFWRKKNTGKEVLTNSHGQGLLNGAVTLFWTTQGHFLPSWYHQGYFQSRIPEADYEPL